MTASDNHLQYIHHDYYRDHDDHQHDYDDHHNNDDHLGTNSQLSLFYNCRRSIGSVVYRWLEINLTNIPFLMVMRMMMMMMMMMRQPDIQIMIFN